MHDYRIKINKLFSYKIQGRAGTFDVRLCENKIFFHKNLTKDMVVNDPLSLLTVLLPPTLHSDTVNIILRILQNKDEN